jgi:type I restriction enzyme S subunit
MGLKIEKINLNLLSSEQSLRYDFSFLEYKKNQLHLIDYYTFSELFEIVEKSNVDLEPFNEINYVEIGDISKQGDINPVKLNLSSREEEYESYYKKIDKGDIIKVMEGDILISSIRPNLKKIALIDNDSKEYFYTKALIHLRPKIDSVIAYYLLRTVNFEFIKSVSRIGKGYPTLKTDDLKTLTFDKQIIDSLLTIDTNKIKRNLNEIKSLIQSKENEADIINEEFAKFFDYEKDLFKTFGKGMTAGTQKSFEKKLNVFQTKFEDLVNSETLRFSTRFHRPEVKFLEFILGKYETIKVKSLLKENEKIHRGTQPKNSENGYIPAIKTGQLKNSYIDLSETDLVEENFYNNQLKARVMNKDILIASTGKVSLGKIDIYEEEQEAVCDGHISIIRVDSKKVINDYFVYFFRSILGTFQIERDYTGATNQIELYANEISSFDIIKVSLEDQARIVKKIKNRIQDQQNYTKQIEEKRTEIEKIILDSLQNV